MAIEIETLRAKIETSWIGFSPSTTSVKPVHIANGLFRGILNGSAARTDLLSRFVISQTEKGEVPKNHALDDVYAELEKNGRLETTEISKEDLARLRVLLKKAVGADGAVYTDDMESYTAGYRSFVSVDRIAQDGGELIAEWLRRRKSPLAKCILDSLQDPDDIITLMTYPLLETGEKVNRPSNIPFESVGFLNQTLPLETKNLWDGLAASAATLSKHLTRHPNKLFRLRMAVLFSSFSLLRHLTSLEASYVGEGDPPPIFLLDFTTNNTHPIARASQMTYSGACQSIARFYAWAFGEILKKEGYTANELRREPCPTYKAKGKKSSDLKSMKEVDEAREIWNLAIETARREKKVFPIYGEALYNMLALQAEGNPIKYLQKLGLRIGLLYPPNQSSQRFVLKQDLLEALVRGAIEPGESSISLPELQDRFWKRYRVIIGGRPIDEELLLQNSSAYQIDSDALRENQYLFANSLSRLNFARLLADGVFQIEAEVTNESAKA